MMDAGVSSHLSDFFKTPGAGGAIFTGS